MSKLSPVIWPHGNCHDWCHLCGQRGPANADIWWAQNAEHSREITPGEALAASRYVRICGQCAARIVEAAQEAEKNPDEGERAAPAEVKE